MNHQKYRMRRCLRCGEIKDSHWFEPGQKYWVEQCRRCQETPVGIFPIMQEERHKGEPWQ